MVGILRNYYSNSNYRFHFCTSEETTGTDLQIPRDMQAGRSHKVNLSSPNIMRPITPHAPCVDQVVDNKEKDYTSDLNIENTYENIFCTISIPKVNLDNDDDDYAGSQCSEVNLNYQEEAKQCTSEEGYETHESEAESEGADVEYTDNDLDEVLLDTDIQIKSSKANSEQENVSSCTRNEVAENPSNEKEEEIIGSETPTTSGQGEDHYLPMSPRKVSIIEQAHKDIIKNLIVFDKTMQHATYEDNPYVEMNIGSEEDTQTYEIVCVNNGRVEPVYMELSDVSDKENTSQNLSNSRSSDTTSNFADTKEHTLKRNCKNENKVINKSECSDADEDSAKETPLESPFSRFSISDTFRPASYYLNASQNHLDVPDDGDTLPPPIPSTSPPCEDLSEDALSKYILDKLDKSDMSSDNSILKMLTTENQKMNTVKRKATSLMIYGSRTSIHDTLSRGEKIRNSRASLNERNRMLESSPNLLSTNLPDPYNSSSVESDSLRSFNAERGSSRLSLDSDVSSKFDMVPSNISSEVTSLNESDMAIDFRHSANSYVDLEMMMKRRPLSDDSIFELAESTFPLPSETAMNVDLDSYLDNLQPSTSNHVNNNCRFNASAVDISSYKDNLCQAAIQTVSHTRCSSTPVVHNSKTNAYGNRNPTGITFKHISEQTSGYAGSQSSCSSVGIPKSPISYYCKNDNEETVLHKNLNNDFLTDKIKEYENDTKLALKTGNDTHASSSSMGFHSRESSAEHSAPYYYSDLSSQEQINILPTSHYLKNTNLYRKLNNQRRRGPLHKKNEISHIHNPIRNNQVMTSDPPFELAAARSVSVEFLSAADKDPEIDLKNIYESTGGRNSKIPESMNLSGLGCKKNSSNNSNFENSSLDSSSLSASALAKLSSTSMSSHCSGNSSNTVYYDAEAEASAYENVICHGEKIWEDDKLWRDNLRRVSHRHARSMDDLDTMPESSTPRRVSFETCGMNSIKRVKKEPSKKLSRNVTYVNCDLQGRALTCMSRDNNNGSGQSSQAALRYFEGVPKMDDNDVYVSLAETAEMSLAPTDEGVYEQLSLESSGSSMKIIETNSVRRRRKFEIDREKLRQWDLMSSGLMKIGPGRVRGVGAGVGLGDAVCSTDTATDSASNEGIL